MTRLVSGQFSVHVAYRVEFCDIFLCDGSRRTIWLSAAVGGVLDSELFPLSHTSYSLRVQFH